MEKLEKHIKEKLDGRKISPSPKAWEQVAAQVGATSTTKKKPKYTYAIAAGFTALVLMSLFFFTSDDTVEQQVVEQNTEESKGLNQDQIPDSFEIGTKRNLALDEDEGNLEGAIAEEGKLKVEIAVANQEESGTKKSIQDSFISETDPLIVQKVNEIVSQVELLESVNTEVSDAEVDSLLRAAQRDILSKQIFTAEGAVDAMALLTEVEDELDESFRDQIFDALKDGYFKLRTAVADRNN